MKSVRVGALSYATEQGLGRLMKSFFDAGAVQDVMIFRHSKGRVTHREWYPPGTIELVGRPFNGPKVDAFVRSVDVMLFFETPFDWGFLDHCRRRGVKTILMPMHEWTPRSWPVKPDALLCPSLLDLDYFKDEFPLGMCEFIPVPVDPSTWRLRTRANRFLHNAGNIGSREHKGTRQLLEAMRHVKSPLSLTVRAQDAGALDRILRSFPEIHRDKRIEIVRGEIPWEELWRDHDVYVAPEKYNGLSLPLQEAFTAGMCVMTTDRYPHNTWLPPSPLIPVEREEEAAVSPNYRPFKESIVNPVAIARKMDEMWGTDISHLSGAGAAWGAETSWKKLLPAIRGFFKRVIDG